MFPVTGDSAFPIFVHFQVILGLDPEQRPGAMQVSEARWPSIRGGTITVGFWLRADQGEAHVLLEKYAFIFFSIIIITYH